MVSKIVSFLLVAGMLSFGSINTLSKKLQFQITSVGLCEPHTFQKPWTQTACMFLGESVCLIFYLVLKGCGKKDTKSVNADVGNPVPNPGMSIPKRLGLFLVLSLCDLAGTTLAGIGLLFTFASVYQMLRGSIIIFTAIWSVLFFKRKMEHYRWTAIGVTVIGLIFVGLSGVLSSTTAKDTPSWEMQLLGCLLIVAGQLANSTQMIIEEKNLKGYAMNPLIVVGSEGVWGFLITISVALPIVSSIPGKDCGAYESTPDALVMLTNNGFLLTMFLTYWLSIAFYNGLSLTLAKLLSSVHRTLIDACRTLFVWTFQLILYYATRGQYGEPWTPYSYLQVIGFGFLVTGTLLYNHIIRLEKFIPWMGLGGAPAAAPAEDKSAPVAYQPIPTAEPSAPPMGVPAEYTPSPSSYNQPQVQAL
ncbi:putative Solute carrier family 35 member F6 [Paratrimastix pyriformis]|uniref:Solute carrier family 35 member F6 n=1 Tax=Paratrimastix pyriformis TaxID=342808 RepID=A0ABQ8U679_9EUKA|nr:putative Solute carrier family 35 member F6 [Paratrimastix pyriformis]